MWWIPVAKMLIAFSRGACRGKLSQGLNREKSWDWTCQIALSKLLGIHLLINPAALIVVVLNLFSLIKVSTCLGSNAPVPVAGRGKIDKRYATMSNTSRKPYSWIFRLRLNFVESTSLTAIAPDSSCTGQERKWRSWKVSKACCTVSEVWRTISVWCFGTSA